MTRIVDLFIQENLLSSRDLERISAAAGREEPLHELVLRSGLVSEEDYLRLMQQAYGYEVLQELPSHWRAEKQLAASLPFMQEHRLLARQAEQGYIEVILSNPFDHLVLDTLKKLAPAEGMHIYLARRESIRQWLSELFQPQEQILAPEEDGKDLEREPEDLEQLKDLASEAPVIRRVNQILTEAVQKGVSDIHIEPFEDRLLVRFRKDGLLQEHMQLDPGMKQAVSTRLKIMARLDIAERRLPQDGRIKSRIAGKEIDIRFSSLPTVYGESLALRLLDRSSAYFSLQRLGFPEREYQLFGELISSPYGIILVTGPTGSGKTTTLYSALNSINSIDKKIITIEDPVEYELDGINQIQINPRAGLGFASGLRSIVRQDPDVILVGEIRDKETADIAIQAALTGHLVFSTLHTNDAAGAVTRLMEIGVEDYLLASALIGVLAQRLLRLLCSACKKEVLLDQVLINKYDLQLQAGSEVIYQPAGCSRCNFTGYLGRIAMFELLLISEEIRELILEHKSLDSIRQKGLEQGMTLLRHDGWKKVIQGVTSVEEVLRVTGQGN